MAFLEPQVDLELDEGEEILYLSRRHWIVLLQRGAIFLFVALIAGGLALYRASGGTFIVSGVVQEEQFDLFNYILLALIVVLAILWWLPRWRNPKKPPRGIPYLIGIGVLLLIFYFRFQGGRLFYVNPYEAAGGDVLNLLLILVAIMMLLGLVYSVIDWANDFLILTNTRVVYDDQQFLVRHIQQQMLISDIQQVNMRQESYLEYWFDYGAIVIRSFSPRRLSFFNTAHPQIMQNAILGEVNKLRRQSEPELLRQMIEDQIYGDKKPQPPRLAIQVEEELGPLPWLFRPNPEIDYEREIVIWRPFWPFLLLALLRPIGSFLLLTIALVVLVQLGAFSTSVAFALWLPVLIACGFWAIWVYEEHEHDLFILTRQNITDVDKRPFGPESRRVAPLGAIQDISYHFGFFEAFLENFFGLGYGDVVVETGGAGGGKFTFKHVPHPRGIQATINDYLTDFRKREKERQLQDALALLKQYHAARQAHAEPISEEQLAGLIAERVASEVSQRSPDGRVSGDTRELAARLPRLRRELRGVVREELLRALWLGRRRR